MGGMKGKDIPAVSWLKFMGKANLILKNPLPFHAENFEKLGDIFRVKTGFGNPLVFSRSAAFAEYALQKNHKNFEKSPIQTRDMAKYLGNGLLTSTGEHWRKQRKLIQPAFHKKQIAGLMDTINSAILLELDKIEPNKSIDIFPVFNDLAFQTVVKSLFSSAVGQKEIDHLQYITEAAQRMLVKELRQPFKRWWFKYGGSIKKHMALVEEAREILRKLVRERKENPVGEGDLLDMLLDARYDDGTAMSEKQLIDEILIFFTAGHETTSNALTFTAELLARHPDIQERIASETKKAKEKASNLIELMASCTYTKQVLEEAMRLYPPVYFIDRINFEEDEFNGFRIHKNSNLLFSIYEIHRDATYWENPQEFDPSRFAEGTKHTAHYFPFGAGPRKCIGNNFAMYEMILAISELVSRYRISTNKEEIEIKPLITLKPKNAILRFEKRS